MDYNFEKLASKEIKWNAQTGQEIRFEVYIEKKETLWEGAVVAVEHEIKYAGYLDDAKQNDFYPSPMRGRPGYHKFGIIGIAPDNYKKLVDAERALQNHPVMTKKAAAVAAGEKINRDYEEHKTKMNEILRSQG